MRRMMMMPLIMTSSILICVVAWLVYSQKYFLRYYGWYRLSPLPPPHEDDLLVWLGLFVECIDVQAAVVVVVASNIFLLL
jgi:hypothetical protein